jgi:hypothetical protein
MSTGAKKVELAANVAIILAAVVFSVVAVMHYTTHLRQPQQISVGKKFPLQNVNWQNNKKTIVFALSTNCHFCSESAGFYRELARQCRQDGVRTVAVFPQKVDAAEAYLKNQGIELDEVRQASFSDVQIRATPTLLLVADGGVVRNVWIGKLPDNIESEVLAKAKS